MIEFNLYGMREAAVAWEEVAEGINTDMALAEKALKAMDAACFGMIPRFWKVGGGFKVDDAVWADPQPTKTDPLPEAKAFNPDHRWVAALGQSGEQDSREREMEENMDEVGNRHGIEGERGRGPLLSQCSMNSARLRMV